MFYETATGEHGLRHNPFKSCVVPRCIGWISSLSADGVVNLAPYSFFNAVSDNPPMVMFSSGGRHAHGVKDSLANVEATGEFVCNLVTHDLREKMNRTAAPAAPGVDEFEYAGLAKAPSCMVAPPRVGDSPIHLECVHHRTIDLPAHIEGTRNAMVIGEVVGIHIADTMIVDGKVDLHRARPIARLGYMDYTVVDDIFEMMIPRKA